MIEQSFAIVAPLFALIGLGFAATRAKVVSEEASRGLSDFVFVLAIPALLFRTVAGADLPRMDPSGYWIAYFAPLAITWMISSFMARRLGHTDKEAAIIGFSTAQANTVLVGIPIVLVTLGDSGKIPIILLLVVHLPLTMSVVTLLIARGESQGSGAQLLRSLATHPILLAIFIGVLWRIAGLPIPGILASVLKFLGDSAAPCALVALGMSMSGARFRGNFGMIGIAVALKLFLMPALVFVFAAKFFALPPEFIATALLFSGCPTGVNAFLIAQRYRSGEDVVSGAIAFSTLLGVFTMTVLVAIVMGLKPGG